MKIDARSVSAERTLECDVCIVGAGAAGITIARKLASVTPRLDVCLLESGDLSGEANSQDLYAGSVVGREYFRGLRGSRLRLFGGSTNHWAGWCRPLDPIDFAKRDWIPHSGWPIPYADVAQYYEQASSICELAESRFDAEPWRSAAGPELPMPSDRMRSAIFQFSPPTRSGTRYRNDVLGAGNIRTFLHANLHEIEPSPDGRRIEQIQIATLAGNRFSLRSRWLILATGGIENARLLLASRRRMPQGIGNAHDQVGRYFMDHPHAKRVLLIASPKVDLRFFRDPPQSQRRFKAAMVFPEATLERERMSRCSLTLDPLEANPDAWPAGSIPEDPGLSDLSGLPGLSGLVGEWGSEGARDRANRPNASGEETAVYRVTYRGEQIPNPESRVTLSQERDATGVPRVELRWNLLEQDLSNIRKASRLLTRHFGEADIGRIGDGGRQHGGSQPIRIIGGNHHIGTTRMSADPRTGVVDRQCRVHGIANLYLAGSSVFPTSGVRESNPHDRRHGAATQRSDPRRGAMRRPILVSRRRLSASRSRVGVALAALALVSIGCSASPSTDSASEASTFSLLATGDTGKQHRFAASLFEGQLAVSQAMAVEDQRQALDAVLLLGDNFYAEGLRRSELVPRIRQNIVRPYCRFLALDGPRSDEVRDACPLSAAERHPIPLYAVLGNHDVVAPESAELQSHTVPEFVPNWSLDASFGRVVEFPQGVSLILLNSDIYKPFDRPAKLTALLRQARGRWRIVAAHRPATVDEFGGKSPVTAALRADLHAATARAQAPVHVFLSGHQHSLQLLASTSPDPYLAVIVGSGARHRPIRAPHPDRVFGLDALGFARIDLRGEGDNERLVVTLFATADFPVLGMEAERVASWSVDRSGRTRNEF